LAKAVEFIAYERKLGRTPGNHLWILYSGTSNPLFFLLGMLPKMQQIAMFGKDNLGVRLFSL